MEIKSRNINTIISPELKTNYKNFPMVPRVIFGSGCFGQLGEILSVS